jgi:methylmalonyl-CoA epimerase
MKIIGIEHVGIAVDDLKATSSFWGDILGILHTRTEKVESEGVNTKIFDTGKGKIELLDTLDENYHIRKFLQKRGPGIHHICLEVGDINLAIKELKESKIKTINEDPIIGAEGYKIVFIHPKFTGGVLVELAEKPI